MIEIISTGALSTVQDMGRTSYRRFGVGTAGAMDSLALAAGNLMLGNSPNMAGIEIPVLAFSVRFLRELEFTVTGADCAMELDRQPILPWWRHRAKVGQVLTLGANGAGFSSGARSYLLVSGGMDVPEVLGSRSTQLRGRFGGHQGRPLVIGDILITGAPTDAAILSNGKDPRPDPVGFGIVPPVMALGASAFFSRNPAEALPLTAVRVLPAAEYDAFDAETVQCFWQTDWKITAQSDRYGYRLAGPSLNLKTALETRSHGVVPGVIQVPPGGPPIIQMRDAQPSGGYPKIGTVIEADLWRLAQAPAGSRIRFVETSYAGALAAIQASEDYLNKVNHLTSLYRSMNV